jgi:murein DD-endopeptidase MepM/ murein hydrolase activator NlpD
VRYGREYDIDPAFAVAFFIHESTAGTAPGWAGLKPDGSTTHNVGNIICAGYDTCYGRFRDYGSWEEGIADWYRLISVEYIEGRGTETVAEIIPIYAPAFENDVDLYVRTVEQMVDSWRGSTEPGDLGDDAPFGNPLGTANTVMTQGYGTGSHAPAVTWGAVDLALDGDGDGRADPEGTRGQPIYATHGGVVDVTRDSWPAGNHVWVMNDQYRTGYAHLLSFAVSDGERVERGTLIGYIGSTGQSSGPHLDYQVWHKENGAWVNVNPLGFGVLNN